MMTLGGVYQPLSAVDGAVVKSLRARRASLHYTVKCLYELLMKSDDLICPTVCPLLIRIYIEVGVGASPVVTCY